MAAAATVPQLMSVPATQHDLDWLEKSLQTAIQLEFATIPPYLCALWSIKDDSHPVKDSLNEIVMEEMTHLGLACNMLNAIGGTPRLLPNAVLAYPDHLPGGVRPNLVVPLQGLTRDALKDVFMEIERPKHDLSTRSPLDETPTIGEFYEAILDAFKNLPDGVVTGQRQLTRAFSTVDNLKIFPIPHAAAAAKAIMQIQEEGEGTSASPLDTSEGNSPADLAHYFRFAEIWHGKTLTLDAAQGKWVYTGAEIKLPDCHPMAPVPKGGYKAGEVKPAVDAKLVEFDQKFTVIVTRMQEAWASGNQGKLNNAVTLMYGLSMVGIDLMKMPRDSGGGNYGQCFRLVAPA